MGPCKCQVSFYFLAQLVQTTTVNLSDTDVNDRPCNKEELFNLRHAMARNVIERIFGVLKHRFRILILSPKYSLQVQAQIPAALCAIHNFIHLHDIEEGPLPGAESAPDEDTSEAPDAAADEPERHANTQDNTTNGMSNTRNRIAEAMWNQYQQVVLEREQLGVDVEDSDSETDDLLGWSRELDEGEDSDEDFMDIDSENDA